jgi:predicted transcriptional regulator
MAGCSDGRAVVVDDANRVIGIVSPSDVSRAIQLTGPRHPCGLRG